MGLVQTWHSNYVSEEEEEEEGRRPLARDEARRRPATTERRETSEDEETTEAKVPSFVRRVRSSEGDEELQEDNDGCRRLAAKAQLRTRRGGRRTGSVGRSVGVRQSFVRFEEKRKKIRR